MGRRGRGENEFTLMQRGLGMQTGIPVKKKLPKKPVKKKIKLPANIYDARGVGLRFLSEAGFGAVPEIKFKDRILHANKPEEVGGIIEEILEAKKKRNKGKK